MCVVSMCWSVQRIRTHAKADAPKGELRPVLRPTDLFDMTEFRYAEIFEGCEYVWEAIGKIHAFLVKNLNDLGGKREGAQIQPGAHIADPKAIFIGEGTVVENGAFVAGPAIIGRNCVIRHGAYIRGDALIGDGCIVGHATELKNSIMLDRAGAPHFAYVGDSILGSNVNLGAGTKLSNVPVISVRDEETGARPTITLEIGGKVYDTGLSKFGAILGDYVQTGCNAVTNPGCIIGARTLVYPSISLKKGYYPPNSIIKLRQSLEIVARR